MTISTTSNSTRALGTGAATVFSYNFVADQASDISVTYYTGSTAVNVINTSLYTLFINPPAIGQIWGIGGTVIYPLSGSPIANGTSLLIERILPITQNISIANQGPFAPEVIEEALDTLCMQVQQLNASVSNGTNISATSIISALGYTPMNGANNLSEIVSPSAARTNLALGTMAIQNANAVAITGGTIVGVGITGSSFAGTIDNTIIGANGAAAGTFTSLSATATGTSTIDLEVEGSGILTLATNTGNIIIDSGNNLVLEASGNIAAINNGDFSIENSGNVVLNNNGSMEILPGSLGTLDNLTIGSSIPAAVTSTLVTSSGGFVSSVANKGLVLKRGANGKTGTLILTGTTAVSVSNTSIATSDIVSFSLNTVGGTVGAIPTIKTITPLTSFTVAGTVGDTSTYNYGITSSTI